MIISQLLPQLATPTLEQELLQALDTVMRQVEQWHTLQRRMQVQFSFDAHLDQVEIEQICDTLQHMQVWADALRRIAEQLEKEVEDTEDHFYTWLID